MPNPSLLACPECGAPLSLPAPGSMFVACAHCGGTIAVAGLVPAASAPQAAAPVPQVSTEDLAARRERCHAAIAARLEGGSCRLIDAASAGVIELKGPGFAVQPLGAVAAGIALRFARDNGVRIDAGALSRIVEATIKNVDATDDKDPLGKPTFEMIGDGDVNLPFLSANDAGPLHLRMFLSPEMVLEAFQAARAEASQGAGGPGSGPGGSSRTGTGGDSADLDEPPKKKWWWPFG